MNQSHLFDYRYDMTWKMTIHSEPFAAYRSILWRIVQNKYCMKICSFWPNSCAKTYICDVLASMHWYCFNNNNGVEVCYVCLRCILHIANSIFRGSSYGLQNWRRRFLPRLRKFGCTIRMIEGNNIDINLGKIELTMPIT